MILRASMVFNRCATRFTEELKTEINSMQDQGLYVDIQYSSTSEGFTALVLGRGKPV